MIDWLAKYWKAAAVFGMVMLLLLSAMVYQECSIRRLKEETEKAQQQVKEAEQAVTDATRKADEVARQTEQQLRQANQIIADMRKAVDESRARERQVLNNLRQMVTERNVQIGSVRDDTDQELVLSVNRMVPEVYPDNSEAWISNTDRGILINRAAAEAFKKSLLETSSRRLEEEQFKQVMAEKDEQMARLEEIVNQRDLSLTALNNRVTALEQQVNTLVASSEAKDRQIEALMDELKAERRRNFWSKWYGRTITIAALVGGVLIGGAIAG